MPHKEANYLDELAVLESGPEQDGVCLVIGDWFVDEHWVCGTHRSSTSSRTGRSHLRALHTAKSNVRAFCGAGRSAQFLHFLYRYPTNTYPLASVIGLGFWHRADTQQLESLFDLESPAQTPYRLTPSDLRTPQGIELINMNDALNFTLDDTSRDAREYTTRIIRIYTNDGTGNVIYDRLDWEPKTPVGQFVSGDVEWKEKLEKLEQLIQNKLNGRPVRAVIIKDLQKGAINTEIINWISSMKLGNPAWFISSKRWKPGWLVDNLGDKVDLRLVMIPQVAAETAIRKSQKLTCWITHSGRPSKEAVDAIEELATLTRAKTLVILPDKFSALACKCEAGKVLSCAVQSQVMPERVTVEMGYASIVFPALIACMSDYFDEQLDLEGQMNLAFRAAHEWVEGEAQRVLDPGKWQSDPAKWAPDRTQALAQIRARLHRQKQLDPIKQFGQVKSKVWGEESREWKEALSDVGIIKRGSRKVIELWRAMPEVEGYVCCEETMRDDLRRLLRGIQSFAKQPRHHASCMLVASPGSGKTFLAKRLAETAGLQFIPFNITQMRAKADILECLDTIVAVQARNSGSPFLVFIDEINAKLENAFVYGAFLTPLEDGTYVHSGRTFTIRPCVWVFAGTRQPNTSSVPGVNGRSAGTEAPEKGSDFVSRLTLGLVNLTSTKGTKTAKRKHARPDNAAIERVYLGVNMLRHEFPDVRSVSELVLRAFSELPEGTSVRDIKHFVRRFSDIQYGEVTARSVPDRWPRDSKDRALAKWNDWKRQKISDAADVKIVDRSD